jgi:hypothetical protein
MDGNNVTIHAESSLLGISACKEYAAPHDGLTIPPSGYEFNLT